MALTVKDNTLIAVEIEDTENTYKAPTSGDSFVQTLSDGLEMTPAKELLERNIFNGSIGKSKSRTGIRSVAGSIPVEFRASETEGGAPEYSNLLHSALGQTRSSSSVISGIGHSTTVINIDDLDIGSIQVGDIVMIKEAGACHVSPVTETDDTLGAASITLLVPADAAPSDNVEISAFTSYYTGDEGHPSLSISKYVENAVLEQATGARVTSLSLDNFTTGQIASWNFGFEGSDFNRSLTPPPVGPTFQGSQPPIILRACVYQDGEKIAVNSLTLSLENTLGFATSTCSDGGRISSRVTERTITGTFNPYKQDDSIEQFAKFKCNDCYSIFAYALIPQVDANCEWTGDCEQIVAIYLPNVVSTEIAESDQDGLLVEDITFQANRGDDGLSEELYVGFM